MSSKPALAPLTISSGSRLLDLPSEIRNYICLLAVTIPRRVEISTRPTVRSDEGKPPSVTQVNRQLRSETLTMFYAVNAFRFWIHTDDASSSRSLGMVANRICFMKKIEIYYYNDGTNYGLVRLRLEKGLEGAELSAVERGVEDLFDRVEFPQELLEGGRELIEELTHRRGQRGRFRKKDLRRLIGIMEPEGKPWWC